MRRRWALFACVLVVLVGIVILLHVMLRAPPPPPEYDAIATAMAREDVIKILGEPDSELALFDDLVRCSWQRVGGAEIVVVFQGDKVREKGFIAPPSTADEMRAAIELWRFKRTHRLP